MNGDRWSVHKVFDTHLVDQFRQGRVEGMRDVDAEATKGPLSQGGVPEWEALAEVPTPAEAAKSIFPAMDSSSGLPSKPRVRRSCFRTRSERSGSREI